MILLSFLFPLIFSIELKSGEEISASAPRHWTYENVQTLTLIPLILPPCDEKTFQIYTKVRYGSWQERKFNFCEYSRKDILGPDDQSSSVYINYKVTG